MTSGALCFVVFLLVALRVKTHVDGETITSGEVQLEKNGYNDVWISESNPTSRCDLCRKSYYSTPQGVYPKYRHQTSTEFCSRCPPPKGVPELVKLRAFCRECLVIVAQTKAALCPCSSFEEIRTFINRMCTMISFTKPIEVCTAEVLWSYQKLPSWQWKRQIQPYDVCLSYGACGLLPKQKPPLKRTEWEKTPCAPPHRRWPTPQPSYPAPTPSRPPMKSKPPTIKEHPLPKISEILKVPVKSPKGSRCPEPSPPMRLPVMSKIPKPEVPIPSPGR